MPLGIDATIRFATHNWTRPLRVSELNRDSPYNTRLRRGLPPTPIGNPGLASLKAAARPAKVSYLYYVVKPGHLRRARLLLDRREVPARRGRLPARRAEERRQVADEVPVKPAPRRAGAPGRPQPLAGDARAPRYRALGLEGWRYQRLPVPPELFDETVRALPGRRVPRRQRDDPPQGGGARAGRRGHRRRPGRSARRTRSPSGPAARSTPTTPTRPACIAALPGSAEGRTALVLGAGGSARAVVWALLDAGAAEVRVWNRTAGARAGAVRRARRRPRCAGASPPTCS